MDDRPVIVEAHWKFLRAGLAYGEQLIVDSIRRQQWPTYDAWAGDDHAVGGADVA